MSCTPIKIRTPAGDLVGFACVRGGRQPVLCQQCGKRTHTKLCDGRVREYFAGTYELGTCDRKLCDDCAVSGGPNVDYCRLHAEEQPRQGELGL